VSYASLRPGHYRFQVQACNNEGIWSVPGAVIEFAIAPYLHQETWFWALAAGLALALLGAWHAARLRGLRRHQEELEQLVAARTRELELRMAERLNLEARLRLSQKMEAVGQLAAGVAHYFNNLLTIIRAHAELLGDPDQSPVETCESTQAIQQASQRAAELVRQLLAFSQRHMLSPVPLDLIRFVRQLTPKLAGHMTGGIEPQWAFPPSLPLVEADPEILEQVVLSLASNARDAMPKGGQLRLALELRTLERGEASGSGDARPGSFVVLSLTDTGVGMSPEVLNRAFEPFFTTKEVGRGTGLGLAAVYGILKQHRGWTEVTSAVGQGTTVRLFLPVMEDAARWEANPAVRGQSPREGAPPPAPRA
jgi:signal transduction histidine kinase